MLITYTQHVVAAPIEILPNSCNKTLAMEIKRLRNMAQMHLKQANARKEDCAEIARQRYHCFSGNFSCSHQYNPKALISGFNVHLYLGSTIA
jgi:hypothetical protein